MRGKRAKALRRLVRRHIGDIPLEPRSYERGPNQSARAGAQAPLRLVSGSFRHALKIAKKTDRRQR